MDKGIDCPLSCLKVGPALKAAGLDFVARYYRSPVSKWTPLKAAEIAALHAAQLKVVALFEYGNKPNYFTHKNGVDDSTSAYRQAVDAGQPAGTPIYFCVDYDPNLPSQFLGIADYFQGVQDGFAVIGKNAPIYVVGVYGSGNTCAHLQTSGLAVRFWLANATGWGGYKTFKNWHIHQYLKPATPFPVTNYDPDEGQGPYGAF